MKVNFPLTLVCTIIHTLSKLFLMCHSCGIGMSGTGSNPKRHSSPSSSVEKPTWVWTILSTLSWSPLQRIGQSSPVDRFGTCCRNHFPTSMAPLIHMGLVSRTPRLIFLKIPTNNVKQNTYSRKSLQCGIQILESCKYITIYIKVSLIEFNDRLYAVTYLKERRLLTISLFLEDWLLTELMRNVLWHFHIPKTGHKLGQCPLNEGNHSALEQSPWFMVWLH